MRIKLFSLIIFLMVFISSSWGANKKESQFIKVEGVNLVKPGGEKFFIQGTNLGNWLNPEGYMFGFSKTNSAWMINQMFCELVGPDRTAEFWQLFKERYITREDVRFIASTGANTIRLPFNYKLFTNEDYMGVTSDQDGFAYINKVVSWCRESDLYLILDMHDCPGGQTGDNIDDSYGYPWLFESEKSQALFCSIWKRIAERYADEPVILGYELMNEPIAHYFDNKDILNSHLEPLYKRAVKEIRSVDKNHVILLGGARWNSDFFMFKDWKFDDNIMYTCHRYGGPATADAIRDYINHRDKTGLPMYMGEIGHNTDEWQADFVKVMKENNIGYTFWPYKKVDNSCFMGIQRPKGWDEVIVKFSESERTTFANIRDARPNQEKAWKLMLQFIENCDLSKCKEQSSYIKSLDLKNDKTK